MIFGFTASLVVFVGSCAGGAIAGAPRTGSDQPPPPEVTSDTLDYCIRLAQEISDANVAPEAARELTEEGQQLCRHGQIRGGITRLRRAMVMVHRAVDPDAR